MRFRKDSAASCIIHAAGETERLPQNVSDPLPPPPTGTSQGPTRELSQGTGSFPLNRIFTGRTSVKRFLRKPKRDASRIRVTRPSPSLLARDLKSMSLRIRCDIKSDRSTPFTKRDPQSMQPRTLKPSVSCESGEVATTGPRTERGQYNRCEIRGF